MYRQYDPNGNKWYVHSKYYDAVKQVMEPYIPKTEYDPWAVLHLRPNAPQAIVKAAYRELVKMHHPDHGGDPDLFRKIQAAYEKLTENT
jgi:DnaJ-class molecular chaperone